MSDGTRRISGDDEGKATEEAFAVEGRRMWMSGWLSVYMAAKIVKTVHGMKAGRDPVELVIICSPGGSADAFWAVVDGVLDRTPVRVFALGEVCSAAAWLMAAAAERYVAPDCGVVVHLPSINNPGSMVSRDAGHMGAYMDAYGRRVARKLPLKLDGLPERYRTAGAESPYDILRAQGEIFLVGEEAVAAGLADAVRVPEIKWARRARGEAP